MNPAVEVGRTPLARWMDGRGSLALAAAAFALLLLVIFGDVICAGGLDMPSHPQGDAARYFLWMRLFGYSELRGGNMPLWNPHVFSGTPFVGVFQSAMFYPPNLLHLFVGPRRGLMLEMFLHQWILGVLAFAWLRNRRLHGVAAFVGATSVVFGATVSLRVLAGQMSVLDTIAWWPLVLLAVDRLAERIQLGWVLVGIGAFALMMLAGHPPTALQAGIATGLYCLPMVWRSDHRWSLSGVYAVVAVAPIGLAAVQLFTGLHTAAEGLRSEGMSYAFATSHSFPPEQLLTLLIPEAFGNASAFYLSYFGRVFYWDATYYIGVVGLVLAIHGVRETRGTLRGVSIVLALALCVVAMGGYTPVYRVFYELVPGFAFIRAPSKFLFFSSLFAGALVALGADQLIRDRSGAARAARVAALLAALAGGIALWTFGTDADDAASPIALLEALPRVGDFVTQGETGDWRRLLLRGAATTCGLATLATALLAAAARRRLALWIVLVLAVVDVVGYARISRGTFRMTVEVDHRAAAMDAYEKAGSQRVLETAAPSLIAMGRRNFGVWGYDPVILGRYLTYMAWTQGLGDKGVARPTRFVPHQYHPSLAMLRTRYSILWREKEVVEHDGAMRPLRLMHDYRVVDTDQVLAAMTEPDFDPHRTVILEQQPEPAPEPPAPGHQGSQIWVVDRSTDHLDLELDVEAPALLLMTDSYSNGWRARPLEGSVQSHYEVLPANYVLRAIPLRAGRHHLRVEYSPWAWRAGVVVSSVSLGIFAAAIVYAIWRRSATR